MLSSTNIKTGITIFAKENQLPRSEQQGREGDRETERLELKPKLDYTLSILPEETGTTPNTSVALIHVKLSSTDNDIKVFNFILESSVSRDEADTGCSWRGPPPRHTIITHIYTHTH